MGKNDWKGRKKDNLIAIRQAFEDMRHSEITWPADKSSKEYREKVDETFAKMVAENKSKGEK
jgi:hypothetical protein